MNARRIVLASLGLVGLLSGNVAFAGGAGPDQNITIKTDPAIESHCLIKNAVNSEVAMHTPQYINVMKSVGPTYVTCISQDGTWRGSAKISAGPGGIGMLTSIPWVAFSGVNGLLNEFDVDGGASGMFADLVALPSVVVVPIHTDIQTIPDASVGSRDEAIANQPAPPPPPIEEATPQAPEKPVVKHRTHHHRVYHTNASHS